MAYIQHYFWLAALIIGTGTPLFWFLKDPIAGVSWLSQPPVLLFYIMCVAAVGIAFFVLALGIDALRGRSMTHLPFGEFMNHAETAYECALEGNCHPTVLTTILNSIDRANGAHIPKVHSMGIKLRWMSGLLLISLGCGILAVLSRIIL